MKLNTQKFFIQLIILLGLMFVLHFLLLRAMPLKMGIAYIKMFEVYVFLFLLSGGHFFAIKWLFKKWSKFAGLLFTGLSLLKMAVCVLYLLPSIFPSTENSMATALNFMVVYFVLLTFEVVFLVKNMNLLSVHANTNKNY